MYILIAGAGEVGRALAVSLASSRHDVVCVDTSAEVCENLYTRHGIVSHCGSGTDIDILRDAGIDKADIAVGTMSTDADNLAFTILARQFDVPRIIARLRNPAYETAFRSAGASRLVNLVDVVLNQLILEIEQPDVRTVATFGGGKASILILNVPADWKGDGATVAQVASSPEFPRQCVITGIFREREGKGEFVIPRGDSEVRAGDRLFLAADMAALRRAATFFGLRPPRKLSP